MPKDLEKRLYNLGSLFSALDILMKRGKIHPNKYLNQIIEYSNRLTIRTITTYPYTIDLSKVRPKLTLQQKYFIKVLAPEADPDKTIEIPRNRTYESMQIMKQVLQEKQYR